MNNAIVLNARETASELGLRFTHTDADEFGPGSLEVTLDLDSIDARVDITHTTAGVWTVDPYTEGDPVLTAAQVREYAAALLHAADVADRLNISAANI